MKWWALLFLLFAAGAVVYKLVRTMRSGRQVHGQDFDAKLISQMRAKGMDPFADHDVDFFFALPDEPASAAVNRQLESKGFRVDVKAVPESAEYPFSVHASKTMRLQVPDMQELTRQFRALAAENRGRYDGWSST